MQRNAGAMPGHWSSRRRAREQQGADGRTHPHAHGLSPQRHLCLEGSAQAGWDGPDP